MTDRTERDPNIESVLLTSEEIGRRVKELAADIAHDYQHIDRLSLIGVLKGACVFMSDLGRALHRSHAPALTYDFIRASTYADSIKGQGETERSVKIEGLNGQWRGRDVLLVEDILDQGFTLPQIRRELIEQERVRSVKCCVLLVKDLDNPSADVAAIRESFEPEYIGFRIPDRWVAGYGLDVGDLYRELPSVVVVNEDRFSA